MCDYCGDVECACDTRVKRPTWTGEAIRETLGWLLVGLMLGGTAFYLLLLWFSGNNY